MEPVVQPVPAAARGLTLAVRRAIAALREPVTAPAFGCAFRPERAPPPTPLTGSLVTYLESPGAYVWAPGTADTEVLEKVLIDVLSDEDRSLTLVETLVVVSEHGWILSDCAVRTVIENLLLRGDFRTAASVAGLRPGLTGEFNVGQTTIARAIEYLLRDTKRWPWDSTDINNTLYHKMQTDSVADFLRRVEHPAAGRFSRFMDHWEQRNSHCDDLDRDAFRRTKTIFDDTEAKWSRLHAYEAKSAAPRN